MLYPYNLTVPTTSGTGSETTGIAIFDYEEMKAKTGKHYTVFETVFIT